MAGPRLCSILSPIYIIGRMQHEDEGSRTELDNHADTCAVGSKSALVIKRHDKQIDVLGYQGSTGDTQTLQVVDAAVVYEGFKGERIMLIINQALEVPGHNINLLSPMQVR